MKRHRGSDSLASARQKETGSTRSSATIDPSPSLSHLCREPEIPRPSEQRRPSTNGQIRAIFAEAEKIASLGFSGGSLPSPSLRRFYSASQLGSLPDLDFAVAADDDGDSSRPKPMPRRPTGEANQRLVEAALASLRAQVRQLEAEKRQLEAENLQLKLEIDELKEKK